MKHTCEGMKSQAGHDSIAHNIAVIGNAVYVQGSMHKKESKKLWKKGQICAFSIFNKGQNDRDLLISLFLNPEFCKIFRYFLQLQSHMLHENSKLNVTNQIGWPNPTKSSPFFIFSP